MVPSKNVILFLVLNDLIVKYSVKKPQCIQKIISMTFAAVVNWEQVK